MSEANVITSPAPPSGLRLVMSMSIIGFISSLLIVTAYKGTEAPIAANKARALEQAVFEVVPGTDAKVGFVQEGEALRPLEEGMIADRVYYACYKEGAFLGVAVEAAGQGFQETIRLLYGFSPESGCVMGIKVLESKETPGLGDKIEKDPHFLANFEALDVSLNESGAVAHPIELVKKGAKTDAWQIDAITGATISSRAVATILRESTAETAPLVSANLSLLKERMP